ncbi:cytochrome-c peroxidase [Azospira inquinata]|uniref:Cytochrome-c peroxidase n=1 Tax=Azospira inquinata TaxID=2785627 RepID=A0A975XVY6_9RHOO|nr:cytochrome c peroxidase [Azospira inquinata]QWT47027.1 hypothetical protein J8L76_04775 [Azospira inquinata]QWT50342.1 cytochrome-c peroxidase [Azospira inquinata]
MSHPYPPPTQSPLSPPPRLLGCASLFRLFLGLALGALIGLVGNALAGEGAPGPISPYQLLAQHRPDFRALAALGEALFMDPGLSASGRLACATCHSPGRAFGPDNPRATQTGGPAMDQVGGRAAPSLRYLQTLPPFSEHFFDNDGRDSEDQGPTGGFTWDGRAPSLHDQAAIPLFAPNEMANPDIPNLAAKLRQGPHRAALVRLFGPEVEARPDTLVQAALLALEAFQQQPDRFYPYSSKYDAYLRGQAKLSRREARGLAVFEDPRRGNCAACHPSRPTADGAFPAFTDFGYQALGLPRNAQLPQNRDPAFFDLGLCGPARQDLKDHAEYCGLFRVPSLRNVALRRVFFHNGVIHSLADALRFYGERDGAPQRWYPRRPDGTVERYNDLPSAYRANVSQEAPFGGRPGERPRLSHRDLQDLEAFLRTLTDGYRPAAPKRSAR